jgi:hypothetical protein
MAGCAKQRTIWQAKKAGLDTRYLEDWCFDDDKTCDFAILTLRKYSSPQDSSPKRLTDSADSPMWFPPHLAYSPEPLNFPYEYPGHWECPRGYEQHLKDGSFPELTGGTGNGSGGSDKSDPPKCVLPGQ